MNCRKVSKSRSVWLVGGAPLSATFHGGREHAPGQQPVEAHARPREHARAHEVEPGERDERDQQHERQHHQRDVARARDHPVVDLEHVERGGEIEQIDGEAEDQRRDEIAPAAAGHQAAHSTSVLSWRQSF